MTQQYHLMPKSFYGFPDFPLNWRELDWLQDLPKNTYFALWVNLPSLDPNPIDLPLGHPLYVITFHQERFDTDWIAEQVKRISAPIIILNDGSTYSFPLPSNVHFYTYYSWHHHLEMIIRLFPARKYRNNIKYKVSNICNRITQSKMIVFTALMEYLDRKDLLIKLGIWLESKNVHNWHPTGNKILDELTDIFRQKYLGTTIDIDQFDNDKDNFQTITSNPWQPVYTESAIHFVGESYHYSLMQINQNEKIIMPGPAFSEKMFKCLVAGTPFVPVAQFESYKHLTNLGLKFDYGDIDTSWDNDPGNITRLSKLVMMIKSLKKHSISDVVEMTKNSTDYNLDFVWSGDFKKRCQLHNQCVANEILEKFR